MLKVFLIAVAIVISLYFVVHMIDDALLEDNKKLAGYVKQYKEDNVMLLKVIRQIYKELSLLKMKSCPEEEFKNIPFELIDWLEQLGMSNAKK